MASHARSAVDNVSSETDTAILAASLRQSLALSIPPPTLYYNYHVGECQDLIFGVSLADYATARGSENDVPKVLKICIDEIDKRGLDAEGIYRVSPSNACLMKPFLLHVVGFWSACQRTRGQFEKCSQNSAQLIRIHI
jgi:hypothetical protein